MLPVPHSPRTPSFIHRASVAPPLACLYCVTHFSDTQSWQNCPCSKRNPSLNQGNTFPLGLAGQPPMGMPLTPPSSCALSASRRFCHQHWSLNPASTRDSPSVSGKVA